MQPVPVCIAHELNWRVMLSVFSDPDFDEGRVDSGSSASPRGDAEDSVMQSADEAPDTSPGPAPSAAAPGGSDTSNDNFDPEEDLDATPDVFGGPFGAPRDKQDSSGSGSSRLQTDSAAASSGSGSSTTGMSTAKGVQTGREGLEPEDSGGLSSLASGLGSQPASDAGEGEGPSFDPADPIGSLKASVQSAASQAVAGAQSTLQGAVNSAVDAAVLTPLQSVQEDVAGALSAATSVVNTRLGGALDDAGLMEEGLPTSAAVIAGSGGAVLLASATAVSLYRGAPNSENVVSSPQQQEENQEATASATGVCGFAEVQRTVLR